MNQRQIKNQVKIQLYRSWGALSQTFREPYQYILILTSVRSGSTLLAHILTSNPQICGIGESKITLTRSADYGLITGRNMYFHWRKKLPRTGDERYILDKMVHDYLLDPHDVGLLKDSRVRVIFLLREPVATLNSFMRVANINEADALAYFELRMQTLSAYARGLAPDKESLLLTYRDMLQCTQPILTLLQEYLELQQPLSENYQVTNATGQFGLGNNSENIKSGRIISSKKSLPNQLSPETMTIAQKAYEQCATILQANCLHITAEQCQQT